MHFKMTLECLLRRCDSYALLETASLFQNHSGLEVMTLLPLLSECWYNRHMPPHLVQDMIPNAWGDGIGWKVLQFFLAAEYYCCVEGSHIFLLNKYLLTTNRQNSVKSVFIIIFEAHLNFPSLSLELFQKDFAKHWEVCSISCKLHRQSFSYGV